jgi:hypothetical protein
MSPAALEVPVVFLVFNRPELTERVFARIREARPRTLWVVADGPRTGRHDDVENCRRVRELIERGIDWRCELVRDYAESNLGCGRRVASGITNAFRQAEEAIILEDDCLPEPSFFRFCAELLEKYRDEPRVGLVSGSHHQYVSRSGRDSYYFCRYGNIWGWATWRRAWQKFDLAMSDWPQWRDAGGVERLFPQRPVQQFWRRAWDRAAAGKIDTWDYQWTYCYLRHGMLGLLPRVALIENIGFGPGATHTIGAEDARAAVEPMRFPLLHPATIEPDLEAEARASRRFFWRPSLPSRLWAQLKMWLTRRG